MRTSLRGILGSALLSLGLASLLAGAPDPSAAADERPNLPLPTLGGRQLWADVHWARGWRVQENLVTGHHRLLDEDDVRRAWGDLAGCLAACERLGPGDEAGTIEHLVVLVHGLGRSRASTRELAAALERDGFVVAAVGYPSTRDDVDGHARRLEALLGRLEGVERISFVGYSLGGVVVTRALERRGPWQARVAAGRVVTIGTPHGGSALARLASELRPVRACMGEAASELGRLDPGADPAWSLGAIAGGRGAPEGFNPLVPGDDDGVVAVAEALFAGAEDRLVVRRLHGRLLSSVGVAAATSRFLRGGRF